MDGSTAAGGTSCSAGSANVPDTTNGVSRSADGQPSSIQAEMNSTSSGATALPPHGSRGNREPSNGASPRRPRTRPERAPRPGNGGPAFDSVAFPAQHGQLSSFSAGAIMRTP